MCEIEQFGAFAYFMDQLVFNQRLTRRQLGSPSVTYITSTTIFIKTKSTLVSICMYDYVSLKFGVKSRSPTSFWSVMDK